MRGHRAAWLSVVAYATGAAALIGLMGCVDGDPFGPEMCVVAASDSLMVGFDGRITQLCALPQIRVEVRR
jgi:hypothetical protein